MLKKSLWPQVYYAKVRIYSPRDGAPVQRYLPFLLPHEVLHTLAENGDPGVLCGTENMDTQTHAHLLSVQEELGIPNMAAVGLWGDGVPFNADRSESLELVSISLPALAPPYNNLRIPVFALSKRFFVKNDTYEDILQVVAWSFTMMASGRWPKQRHDANEFLRTDRQRKRMVGRPLACQGAVCEVRGDWAFSKIPCTSRGGGMPAASVGCASVGSRT